MAREILFRGKRADNGEWVKGTPFFAYPTNSCKMIQAMAVHPDFVDEGNVYYSEGFPVVPETVGQFTGVHGAEFSPIYEGDIVRFLRYVGTVVFEEGCFGIAINETIDWDYIAEEMAEYAGTNPLSAVCNDNFISLWEILWNFDCEENVCNVVESIGNIHDNPELLEVSNA